MAELFGFSFKKRKDQEKSLAPSPVAPSNEDGATSFIAGGYYGQYVDLDGNFKTEYDMVKKYREMAMHPEVDSAIEDIVHEIYRSRSKRYSCTDQLRQSGSFRFCQRYGPSGV